MNKSSSQYEEVTSLPVSSFDQGKHKKEENKARADLRLALEQKSSKQEPHE